MDQKDYYRILGIERGASDEEVKRAYRKLAQELHPDKHPGNKEMEEKFKVINEAYDVLKDSEKRAQYDRFGYVGTSPGGYREANFGADFQDLFSEVFSDFFGAGRRHAAPERGADLRYDLEIAFEEAAFGADKTISIPKTSYCSACGGSGARQGTSPTACQTCKGTGQVRYQQGFFSISRPCSVCRGAGTVIKDPCGDCRGAGTVRVTKAITVKIPPGVDVGSRLRIQGEGEPGERGGRPGDLYIFLSVSPHPLFRRENDDVVIEVPISFPQASLGAEIEVPTIDGRVKLKVPPGIQSGKMLRIKGKGIASLQTGRRGDAQVVIKVETPSKLNKRQRELLEEFASISGEDTTPQRKNFFSKVKEMFE